jgi:glycosyltransferase involved in cell wall biosynthesis
MSRHVFSTERRIPLGCKDGMEYGLILRCLASFTYVPSLRDGGGAVDNRVFYQHSVPLGYARGRLYGTAQASIEYKLYYLFFILKVMISMELKNKQPKVSVIVPVYNAGKFFVGCMDSLVNQTLTDIEIILVLDCPTDGSDLLAKQYARKDERIKVVENESNLHVGFSRNKGLAAAAGEYIGFCDHDDCCEPDMFELLYKKASSDNLDIAGCNYTCKFITKKGITEQKMTLYQSHTFDKLRQDSLYEIITRKSGGPGLVWHKLFKADFLRQNSILFVDTKKVAGEDVLFSFAAHYYCRREGFVEPYLYWHHYYPESTGAKQGYYSCQSAIAMLECMHSLLVKFGIYQKYQSVFINLTARYLYSSFYRAIAIHQKPLKDALGDIRLIKKSKIVKEHLDLLLSTKQGVSLFKKKPTAAVFLLFVKVFF